MYNRLQKAVQKLFAFPISVQREHTVVKSCSGWHSSVADFHGWAKNTRLPNCRQDGHTAQTWNSACRTAAYMLKSTKIA
jgi:hypothetical protein